MKKLKLNGPPKMWMRFLALNVFFVCCLAASSFAQPGNDDCSMAQTLNVGPECVCGHNINATVENYTIDDTTCNGGEWADNDLPLATVWYKFTPTSDGWYTVSMDNGDMDPDFSTDSRIKLLTGTCSTGWTNVLCNDDVGSNGCNTLAGQITAELVGGVTYYIMADAWHADSTDTTYGTWCINVFKVEKPANDCVLDAIDITTDINALSPTNLFDCKAYMYNPFTGDSAFTWEDPISDYVNLGLDDDNGCSNVSDPGLTHYGIWFKFNYVAGATDEVWLNAFPSNGCGYYIATLFEETGTVSIDSCDTSRKGFNMITGLEFVDCSVGDGEASNGGDRDKAKGSNFSHPRLDISDLTDGSTYYVRIDDYTAILLGDTTGNTIAPAPEGIINLCVELEHTDVDTFDNVVSADGLSNDSCCVANDIGCDTTSKGGVGFDFNATYTNLSNAGSHGNDWTFSTVPTVPDGCQPDALTSELTGYWQDNCGGDTTWFGSVTDPFINNPAIYKFTINDDVENVPPRETLCETLKDLIDSLDALVIEEDIVDPNVGLALAQLKILVQLLCDEIDLTVCPTIYGLLTTLCTAEGGPPCPITTTIKGIVGILCNDDEIIVAPCQSVVTLTFNNLKHGGVNGEVMYAFVYNADPNACKEPIYVPLGGASEFCEDCLEMGHQVFTTAPLPNGTYYIVVDGVDGQLVQYDLTLDIKHQTPGGLPCGSGPCPPSRTQAKPVVKPVSNLTLNSVRPVPATDRISVAFTSPESQENVSISVFDTRGKEIYTSSVSVTKGLNVQNLDISGFAKGVYLITINNGTDKVQSKFVKID